MSNRTYTCDKPDCKFCYEMNRPKVRPYRTEPYSDWEVKYLENNYGKVKTEFISRYLNRSLDSIWQKTKSIKLKSA